MTSEHLSRSRKQEQRGARLYNGTVNVGSGNKSRKNDVRSDDWSIEFKTTTAASYGLKLADLALAESQALREHRRVIFGIDFVGREMGSKRVTSRYAVLTEDDLLGVLAEIDGLRAELEDKDERIWVLQRELEYLQSEYADNA
jgi:hypothetical protein